MNIIDIKGLRFERWTVLYSVSDGKVLKWTCRCDCGTEKIIPSQALRTGMSKSCGCLKKELNDRRKISVKEKKIRQAARAKIVSKTPKRRQQKKEAQIRYRITDKAAFSQLKQWCKKKNKELFIDEKEHSSFRNKSCHKCEGPIERTGVGFLLIDPKGPVSMGNVIPTCGVCKLIKPKETFNPIDHARKILRRQWKKTPMVSIARQKARLAVGRYQCAFCMKLFSDKQIQIDHINPVVEVNSGFINLDEFAKRLFCDDSNLQILCKPCHKEKTASENRLRKTLGRKKTI